MVKPVYDSKTFSEMYNRHMAVKDDRIAKLESDNQRYMGALEKISHIDYRGYPHQSAGIAKKALEAGDE